MGKMFCKCIDLKKLRSPIMYQQTVNDIYLFLEHGIWKYLKIVSKSYGYICNSRIIITETIQGLFIKMNFSRFSFFGS